MIGSFLTAIHIFDNNNTSLINQYNIVIPTINLLSEVHNEDFHYF